MWLLFRLDVTLFFPFPFPPFMGGLGPKHVDTHTRTMQLRLYCQNNKEQVNNGRLLRSLVRLAAIYISAAIMGILHVNVHSSLLLNVYQAKLDKKGYIGVFSTELCRLG